VSPPRESRPGGYSETASKTHQPHADRVSTDFTQAGRNAADDALATIGRPYKPSTGLRASGYREGWQRCLIWTQTEFGEHLDEIGQARLAAVVARSVAAEERPSANNVEHGRRLCR
jgi:hypothetical protein